ncbi:MAG: DUF4838 domain-containing protein, partial [Lentisphaerae bacterium]|nr:DUF4838 domain-containing protein [Lentisphaerota bacterium]
MRGWPAGLLLLFAGMCAWVDAGWSAPLIVKDGQAQAQIVIAPERPRMVSLAALELQDYLEKVSGARLPIVTEPAAGVPVSIYVGQSAHTDKLGINAEGLQYGAFRMVSGPDWLVLLGNDFDYNPPKPYPAASSAIPAAQEEFDKLTAKYTDSAWELPWRSAFKAWWNPRDFDKIMGDRYGTNNLAVWNPKGLTWSRDYYAEGVGTGFWKHDEGGSLNAVYAFLRSLGVEWYMPGDLGEVIPEIKTIALPEVNETSKPDFAMRSWFWYNYAAFPFDHTIWARRLGMNNSYEVLGDIGHAHGLVNIHGHKAMREKHPEYYALYGGVRDTEHRGHGTACHSSAELEQECVNFGRFMFDHYNEPHISLFPSDGFKICGCEKCQGKTASELVWGFVDRIARELYKTHPDRIVSCGAYTSYVKPPDSIEKFTPNMMVVICNRGRALLDDPVKWEEYWSEIEGWSKKVAPGRLMRGDNNRFTLNDGRPVKFPALHPHAMAKDIAALKGICLGEYSEESQHKGRWKAPGCDHLNLYVQSRFLWDADQDIETILNEYFTEFYGPVAAEMKAAFTTAELDFNRLRLDTGTDLKEARINSMKASVAFSEGLHQALVKAGPDTVYGQRIQFILDEIVPLADLKSELETAINAPDPRQDAPVVVGRDAAGGKSPETYAMKD